MDKSNMVSDVPADNNSKDLIMGMKGFDGHDGSKQHVLGRGFDATISIN